MHIAAPQLTMFPVPASRGSLCRSGGGRRATSRRGDPLEGHTCRSPCPTKSSDCTKVRRTAALPGPARGGRGCRERRRDVPVRAARSAGQRSEPPPIAASRRSGCGDGSTRPVTTCERLPGRAPVQHDRATRTFAHAGHDASRGERVTAPAAPASRERSLVRRPMTPVPAVDRSAPGVDHGVVSGCAYEQPWSNGVHWIA